MRELAKGLYVVDELMKMDAQGNTIWRKRYWHDCQAPKRHRIIGRVELEDRGRGLFKCKHCDFSYQS